MSWSEIKYALNSTLGTSNFKSLDKLLQSYISTGGNIKCVKRVQRGTVSFNRDTVSPKTISINSINTSKSVLFVNHPYYDTGTSDGYAVTGVIVSSSSIKLYADVGTGSGDRKVPWQVIEFY